MIHILSLYAKTIAKASANNLFGLGKILSIREKTSKEPFILPEGGTSQCFARANRLFFSESETRKRAKEHVKSVQTTQEMRVHVEITDTNFVFLVL